MTYKNPRLKHVKKIQEIVNAYESLKHSVEGDQILNQCNLLLETKKKNKDCECKDPKCPYHYKSPFKPSPQPEIEYPLRGIAMSPLEEAWFDTLTELVERVNKLTKTK